MSYISTSRITPHFVSSHICYHPKTRISLHFVSNNISFNTKYHHTQLYIPTTCKSPHIVFPQMSYLITPRILPDIVFDYNVMYKHISDITHFVSSHICFTPNLVFPYISYRTISHNTYLYIPTSHIFQVTYLPKSRISSYLVLHHTSYQTAISYLRTYRTTPHIISSHI